MSNGTNSPEIDKEKQYGHFFDSVRWQQELDEDLARMSLDIPRRVDDTKIQKVTQVKNGWGWKEIAVAGGLGLGLYGLATREPPAAPPPPAPAVAADHQDLDTNTHRSVVITPHEPGE